jgi:hypothetical protein
LRRLLLILSVLFLTAFYSKAQKTHGSLPGGEVTQVKLYPNPASTYVTFDLQKGYQKGLTLTIFNFLGKKMSETPNVNEKITLTLTDYNRGVYIYHLIDQGGKVVDTGKFQVSK